MKFYIQDQVRIGRYEHLRPLQGRVGEIVSFANASDANGPYQRCNIRCVNGERIPCIDSRVLSKETK